ncbi:peptidase M75, partial [Amycolatopsis sp. NPDC059090]
MSQFRKTSTAVLTGLGALVALTACDSTNSASGPSGAAAGGPIKVEASRPPGAVGGATAAAGHPTLEIAPNGR